MCHALLIIGTKLWTAWTPDGTQWLAGASREDLDLVARAPIRNVDLVIGLDDLLRRLELRGGDDDLGIGKGDGVPVVVDREARDGTFARNQHVAVRFEGKGAEVGELDLGEGGLCLLADIESYNLACGG